MGQSNSQTLGQQKELLKTYSIDSKSKQQNLTYLTHKTSQQSHLLREIIYTEENDFKDMLKRIEQRKEFRSPHLTNLIQVEHFQEDNLCSKYHRIYALWDNAKTTLADVVSQRALSKQPFPPAELRSLLSQIAKGMLTLQKNRICHESISTKTILIEQPFNTKVVDPISMPLQSNIDQLYHKRTLKNIYLSPEQCQMIADEEPTRLTRYPFREDVFTTGMVVLESGLLQRQDECYSDECATVNWEKVEQNLNRFQESYGVEFRNVVEMMLRRKAEERIDWFGLDDRLSRGDIRTSRILSSSYMVEPARVSLPPVRVSAVPIINVIEPIMRTSFLRNQNQRTNLRFTYNNTILLPQSNQQVNSTQVSTTHQNTPFFHPPTIIHPPTTDSYHHQPFRVGTAHINHRIIDSKYTPVAMISNEKYQETTNIASSITYPIQPRPFTIDNDFRNYSPVEQKTPSSEIKNFQLNLNEPVYAIDEYNHGSKYEGYKLKGKRQGWGKFYFQEGGYYEGEWHDNLMSGKGKLYYQSGRLAYDGYWQKDQFHGFGKLYNEIPDKLTDQFNYQNFDEVEQFWISYEGNFYEDMKEGKGKLILSNDQIFEGYFERDTVEGEGVYTFTDGRQIHGIWRENRLEREL